MKLTELHDATFVGLTVAWEAGEAALQFRLHPAREVILQAFGFSEILVPRRLEWGPSESVNEVRELLATTVEVELQSGDTIRLRAERFLLREVVVE